MDTQLTTQSLAQRLIEHDQKQLDWATSITSDNLNAIQHIQHLTITDTKTFESLPIFVRKLDDNGQYNLSGCCNNTLYTTDKPRLQAMCDNLNTKHADTYHFVIVSRLAVAIRMIPLLEKNIAGYRGL
ncbi:hypothetical protein AB4254_08285 [Vibrio breoganii]